MSDSGTSAVNEDRKGRLARDLIRQLDENTLPYRSSLPVNWALLRRVRRDDALPGDFRSTQQYIIDAVLEDIDESDYPEDEELLEAIKDRLSDIMDMTLSSPQVTPTNSSGRSSSESRNVSSEEFAEDEPEPNNQSEDESSDADSSADSLASDLAEFPEI